MLVMIRLAPRSNSRTVTSSTTRRKTTTSQQVTFGTAQHMRGRKTVGCIVGTEVNDYVVLGPSYLWRQRIVLAAFADCGERRTRRRQLSLCVHGRPSVFQRLRHLQHPIYHQTLLVRRPLPANSPSRPSRPLEHPPFPFIRLAACNCFIAASRRKWTRPNMATAADQPPTTLQSNSQQTAPGSRPQSSQEALSSSPVEMRTLQAPAIASTPADTAAHDSETPLTTQVASTNPHISEMQPSGSATPAPSSSVKPAPPSNLARAETEAIGPSTDTAATVPDNTNGPTLVIMLLLTTGARHPYKIDERYLKKRNVTVEAMDPYTISVYTLKELIWRDWREGTFETAAGMVIYGARSGPSERATCFSNSSRPWLSCNPTAQSMLEVA